ncbi:MAG TPA: PEGA domain-containing protein, partial [Vicinamibacterales bacterium]|nr:PEGA domain-containing protein [Vicinamibacterales bacterium]
VDERADVYSLGAIAHELLTRRRPAGAGEQDGALATGLTPEQRVHVRRILSAALAERPEHRFATPAAFSAALAAVVRGETPALPPEPEPAATPVEKQAKKKAAASVPLLEQLEPAPPVVEPPAPAPVEPPHATPATAAATSAIDLPVMPPVAEPAPHTPLPDQPIALEPVDPKVLEHFKSEGGRMPAAPPAPPPPDLLSVPPSPPSRPEPFSTRARAVPPPTFLTPPPETPSFPWLAVAAGLIAGIALGGIGGYLLGSRQAERTAAVSPAPRTTPPADTEVKVPPAPVTTPVPEPGTRRGAAPPPDAEHAVSEPPKPTPTSRPAPVLGVAIVRSTPSGALVTIDGHAHGTTPATVRELLLGSHTLQVARPGYVPSSQPFVLTAAQPSREITVELQAAPDSRATARTGSLFVDTRPPGAAVIVDGRTVGVTPTRLAAMTAGSHTVRIELQGYRTVATSVEIKGGVETPLKLTLELVGKDPQQ